MKVEQVSLPPRAKRAVVVQKSADPQQSQPVYTAMALDGTSVMFRSVTELSLFSTLTPEALAAALKAGGDPSSEHKAGPPAPPKGPTADEVWERGSGGLKRAVPGVLVALTPTAASAMSGPEIGSYVVQQLKIPQSIATPVGETVKTLPRIRSFATSSFLRACFWPPSALAARSDRTNRRGSSPSGPRASPFLQPASVP